MTDPSPWVPVVDHALQALIPAGVTVLILWRKQNMIRDELANNQLVLRTQSRGEHQQNQAKLDGLAEQAAVVVTQQAAVASQLTDAIAENTSLTIEAASASKEAADVANHMNEKFDKSVAAVQVQQAQEQSRQDDHAHDRREGDSK